MATPIPTDLASIMLAVRDRLVSTGYQAYIGLNPDLCKTPPDDRFFVLVPSTQVVDQGAVTGGGTTTMLIEGECEIWLWCRVETDLPPRSDSWLTHTSVGALAALKSMIVQCQMWQPLDSSGNGLTYVPLKLQTIERGKRSSEKHNTIPPGWGHIVTHWRFKWWFDLTSPA